MNRTTLQVACLLFAALAMGMHLAHALELHPKLQWGPELYFAVQSTLYKWFGIIGPLLEIAALVLIAVLAYASRANRVMFPCAAFSAGMLVVGLGVWAAVVMPANIGLSTWAITRSTPDDWMALRAQWQFGQAGILGLHLLGFCALATAVVRGAAPAR